jgi:hypothetical protein
MVAKNRTWSEGIFFHKIVLLNDQFHNFSMVGFKKNVGKERAFALVNIYNQQHLDQTLQIDYIVHFSTPVTFGLLGSMAVWTCI